MRPPSGLTVRESPRAVHAQSPPLIDLSGLSDGKSLPDILHLLERRLTQLEDVVLPSYLAEGPAGQTAERWLLPLAIVWADDHVSPLSRDLALAYVSFDRSAGLLTDAFSLPLFAHSVLEALASAERMPSSEGEVAFEGCDEAS